MGAPKGNQYWKLADMSKIGRPPRYKKPEELLQDAYDYFQYCDNNPIITTETTTSAKGTFLKTVEHRVPYTIDGLYTYLGVCNLDYYKTKEEFSWVLTYIRQIIRDQKYTGAAAGIFNGNIIARDLGLADKKEIDHSGTIFGDTNKEKLEEKLNEIKRTANK